VTESLRSSATFLTDIGINRPRVTVLSEIRDKKQKPREPLFTRIEQLVDQVLLDTAVPAQQISHEDVGKCRFSYRIAIIAAFLIEVIKQSSIAVVVAMRRGWPFRLSSPKNWVGSKIPTTTSFPCSDTTVSLTLPSRM
jgi:hypothetical protein